MFIVYINLQILASIFYSLFHIFYLLLVYCTYFIFSILLLEALITEEPSDEHKFSGGWLLFLFIFSHIHLNDYVKLLLKRIQQIRIICFLRDITPGRIATLSSGVTPNPRSITPSASGPQISRCVVSSKMFVNIKNT